DSVAVGVGEAPRVLGGGAAVAGGGTEDAADVQAAVDGEAGAVGATEAVGPEAGHRLEREGSGRRRLGEEDVAAAVAARIEEIGQGVAVAGGPAETPAGSGRGAAAAARH